MKSNKKLKDKKGDSKPQAPKQFTKKRCRGCGWDLKRKEGKGMPICPRNDFKGCKSDNRRNYSGQDWQDSEVGKKWAKFTPRGLPRDPKITLENAHEHYTKSKLIASIQNYCANLIISPDVLIDFSIVNEQQREIRSKAGGEQESEREAPAMSGRLLLDTGAIGHSVVSSTFYNNMLKNSQCHTVTEANNSLISALNDKTETITKEVTFQVKVNDINNESIILTVNKALVADINLDLIIDRKSIKTDNLVYHFPDHFAEGELLDSIKSTRKPASKANWHNSSEEEQWNHLAAFFKSKPSVSLAWINQLQSSASIPRQAFKRQLKSLKHRNSIKEYLKAINKKLDSAKAMVEEVITADSSVDSDDESTINAVYDDEDDY